MRRTLQEIDTEIVDTAAGLFAVHGFDRTSVQQVADAVGYSKTGLLHHFPSKQALLDAVDDLIAGAIDEIQAFGDGLADEIDGRHRLLTMITDTAMKYPGLVQYLLQGLNALQPGAAAAPETLQLSGDRIVEFVAGPGATAERVIRVILALELICSGVVLARHPEHHAMQNELGPLLVELAEGVIGAAPPDAGSSGHLTR